MSPALERHLWRLAEKLARRLRENDLAAAGVVLKLKTAQFSIRTRAARLPSPTVLPDRLFAAARDLLVREATGTAFRLIGIGANPLVPRGPRPIMGDLADAVTPRLAAAQAAIDALRERYGAAAIGRGRGFGEKQDGGAGGSLTLTLRVLTSPRSGRGYSGISICGVAARTRSSWRS